MNPLTDPYSKYLFPGLAIFSAMALTASGQQLPEPLLYYPLDEAIGATVAVDRTGNGYDGSVVNSVTFGEAGAPGSPSPSGAARFTDGILNIPTFDVPALLGNRDGAGAGADVSYTMAAWIKPDPASLSGDRFIIGQTAQGIHNGLRDNGRLHQAHWANDHYGDTVLNSSDWVHATFVYDGTLDLGTIYLNGVADSAPTAKASPNGSGNLILGGRQGGQNGGGGEAWYNGMVDDFAVWNLILTDAQIQALANGANPFSPLTGEDDENGGLGDGMDDGWETANGLDPEIDDSGADPDNDGLTNIEEFNGGENSTDPKNADSDGDDLDDGTEVNGVTDPNDSDSDDDGLNDGAEVAAMTDPNDPDSDDDEMGDGYEVDNGHDPLLAADAAEDADTDGSLNLEECQRGTDPNVQDTDMDGLLDGVESGTGTFVNASDTGTDPLDPDTDGDELNDGDELVAGTDPHNPDTDGDTVPDGLDDDPLSGGRGFDFGLVAYWPLDEDLNNATVDDYHGTEDGGVIPFEVGKFGSAINLDGSQSVIIGGDENAFDFAGGSFSVSAWYTAAVIDTSWQCLVAKGEGNGWRVHRRGGDNPPEMTFTGGNGDVDRHNVPIIIGGDPETWHHVAGVTDSSTSEEILYLDGVEVARKGGATLEDRGNPMRIGENPDALNRRWKGKVDDLAIWARALSADEVGLIWNGGDGTSIDELTGGGGAGFRILDVTYNQDTDMISLTWTSKEGESYGVFVSPDMKAWDIDLDDGYPADPGESTTFTFAASDLGNPVPARSYFLVRKN